MQYLFLIYEADRPDDADIPPELIAAEMAAYRAFTRETMERGYLKGGEALQPTTTATSVRVRDGRTSVTDGPFAETKEALGGYFVLDCPDLDTAIELAAKIPGAQRGTIEVRPIWEVPSGG